MDNRLDSSTSISSILPAELAGLGRKNVETFSAIQTQALELLEHINRDWWARLNDEAALTSDFAKKLTVAKSMPEAAQAYQELMTGQMEILSKHSQKVMDETMNFVSSCSRLGVNSAKA
jgi:IS1 family transposase